MGSIDNINAADAKFQTLLERFLRLRAAESSIQDSNLHLDDDTLTALTEGNLSRREALPVVSHLSDCSFCRHKTAELVKLAVAFEGLETAPAADRENEPVRVSGVLSGIVRRLFDMDGSAVFAHEEKPEAESEKEGESNKKTDQ